MREINFELLKKAIKQHPTHNQSTIGDLVGLRQNTLSEKLTEGKLENSDFMKICKALDKDPEEFYVSDKHRDIIDASTQLDKLKVELINLRAENYYLKEINRKLEEDNNKLTVYEKVIMRQIIPDDFDAGSSARKNKQA